VGKKTEGKKGTAAQEKGGVRAEGALDLNPPSAERQKFLHHSLPGVEGSKKEKSVNTTIQEKEGKKPGDRRLTGGVIGGLSTREEALRTEGRNLRKRKKKCLGDLTHGGNRAKAARRHLTSLNSRKKETYRNRKKRLQPVFEQ